MVYGVIGLLLYLTKAAAAVVVVRMTSRQLRSHKCVSYQVYIYRRQNLLMMTCLRLMTGAVPANDGTLG